MRSSNSVRARLLLPVLALAAASITGALAQENNEGTLLLNLGEPLRNCPTLTFRLVVVNTAGTRISGITPEHFLVTENQNRVEAGVQEIAPGDYLISYDTVATSLRIALNVTVTWNNARGFTSRLVTSCALRITCGDLPRAVVGLPYSGQLHFSVPEGYGGQVISLIPASPSLQVNATTGALTGMFSTPGIFNFAAAITIVDALSGAFTAQQACQINVDLPPISFKDFAPKSATACSPSFPMTATGTGFLRPQGNVGSFIVFDNTQLTGGTLNADATVLTYSVPAAMLRQFRSPIAVGVVTRATGITPIDSGSFSFVMRRTPTFSPNFTTTSLRASAPTGTTPLDVDALNRDSTTRLRFTVGGRSQLLTARSAAGDRMVFAIPNELISIGGTATIMLVNADESNPQGEAYDPTCATNSFRTLTLGPATVAISSLNPRVATACAPPFTLTVNGSSMTSNSTVEWDGSTLPNFQFLSPAAVSAQVTAALLGTQARTVQVRVTTTGANPSAPEAFTVRSAPGISRLSTSSFTLNSGDQRVTASGSNFVMPGGGGATQVRWIVPGTAAGAPVALETQVESATQLTFTVPGRLLAAPGNIMIAVVNVDEANPNGAIGTITGACPAPFAANVANPPATIRLLEPSSTVAASPTPVQVTITGSGFLRGAEVLVNGAVQAGAVLDSETTIRVPLSVAQLASPGTLQIAVRNPNAAASTASAFQVLPVPVPRITLTANPAAPAAVQDFALSIAQSDQSPRQLRATLQLLFEPNADNIAAGATLPDEALPVFAAGGRTFTFDITGNGALPSGAVVRPGTVAGTVTVRMTALIVAGSTTVSLLPSPAPEVRVVIPRTAPVIESARIVANASGFDLEILGFSPVRNLTSAIVQVNPVSGTRTEGELRFTVDVTSRFNDWFRDNANLRFGGAFRLRIPFTLTNGDASAIDSVSVTLTNTIGTSAAATGRR